MFKKTLIVTPALLTMWTFGCSESEIFKSNVNTKVLEKKAEDARAELPPPDAKVLPPVKEAPQGAGQVEFEAAPSMDSVAEAAPETTLSVVRKLTVILPSTEIRSGKKTLQAKASITGAGPVAITWKLVGPGGIDIGSIDSKGFYTSPADETIKASIQIVATLNNDPSISDKQLLNLIPVQQLFVGCKVGNTVFPISGDIYALPEGSKQLPDFSAIAAAKKETICLDKYDIPVQGWAAGFPASPAMNEWFALHSSANLIIPADGEYSFKLSADDGANLYIDGKLVVDNNGIHSMKDAFGKVNLTAGKHKIIIDWYQGPRIYLGLQLFWQTPGSSEHVIIPNKSFATYISGQ
ncbi:MAG: hypothetical protein H7318_16895 [Oligoflexus sp.]|nr:hypothetical protein [Oligoflexus sp.]